MPCLIKENTVAPLFRERLGDSGREKPGKLRFGSGDVDSCDSSLLHSNTALRLAAYRGRDEVGEVGFMTDEKHAISIRGLYQAEDFLC